jgi:hypothetical protein
VAQIIQAIFVDPPIAIARLGGSNAPQDAYRWTQPVDPRTDGNTVIDPWWTLDVLSDASVEPRTPTDIHLRDGELIRPVAPFFEVWALVGDTRTPSQWKEVPVTPALLRQNGTDETAISIRVDAKNLKAARRRINSDLVFGTFPPLSVRADDHAVHTVFGVSPPGATRPMIPLGRSIPLGSIQVMRSRTQPHGSGASWEDDVNVEIVRFRFTPGRGRFYGPPEAARETSDHGAAVEEVNAFLDPAAGWFGQRTEATVEPPDTYDMLNSDAPPNQEPPSLGVVDDTCEARIEVTLTLPGRRARTLSAHANVFVGPPDFAPDRRPFLSLADELNDRDSFAAVRDAALSRAERQAWVQDLFERIYETVSLFNLDHFQNERSIRLDGRRRRRTPIRGDQVTTPRDHAMTRVDALRNDEYTVPAANVDLPLPLTEHARTRHRLLQDIDGLREFIAEHPERLETLIRQPFEIEPQETAEASTMRMPPFMRHSNANPLTLSAWQYALLMKWVKSVREPRAKKVEPAMRRMSKGAAARRAAVLARLDVRR